MIKIQDILCIHIFLLFIFYILGGIVGGLFLLNRQKWLLWKAAIYWALFIGVMSLLSGLNFLSLSWLGYDTAISTQNFMMKNILFSIINLTSFVLPVNTDYFK